MQFSETTEVTANTEANVTEGVTKAKTAKSFLDSINNPKVWVQVNCEQASPITIHIENLPPFLDAEIDDSVIDDECLGFRLLMQGEECATYSREIPEDKRLVVSYILQKEQNPHDAETIKSTSIKIDFLIGNNGDFRPSKFSDPHRFDDTEARAFLASEIFYFAKHLEKIFEARREAALFEQTAPNYLAVGEIRNRGGKIFTPPDSIQPSRPLWFHG